MSQAPVLIGGFASGVLLGAIFYGGLWWTVRRAAARTRRLWLPVSFLVRATLAVAGFYVFARREWQGLAACFLGFLAARIAVSYLVRSNTEKALHISRVARP